MRQTVPRAARQQTHVHTRTPAYLARFSHDLASCGFLTSTRCAGAPALPKSSSACPVRGGGACTTGRFSLRSCSGTYPGTGTHTRAEVDVAAQVRMDAGRTARAGAGTRAALGSRGTQTWELYVDALRGHILARARAHRRRRRAHREHTHPPRLPRLPLSHPPAPGGSSAFCGRAARKKKATNCLTKKP